MFAFMVEDTVFQFILPYYQQKSYSVVTSAGLKAGMMSTHMVSITTAFLMSGHQPHADGAPDDNDL